jgi:hypothetical protein
MTKDKSIQVLVESDFREQLKRKSEETGVPLSEVARRAWKVWIETGELPKLPEKKGGKHKTK